METKGLEDFQKEYNMLAPQAGDLSYRIAVMQQQLAALYQKMNEVNEKAAELIKKAKEEKVEEKKDAESQVA